jgi:hypothetical protein
MEATEKLLANEQTNNKQLLAGSEQLAADLAGAKAALEAAQKGLEAESEAAAELRAELENIKSARAAHCVGRC